MSSELTSGQSGDAGQMTGVQQLILFGEPMGLVYTNTTEQRLAVFIKRDY